MTTIIPSPAATDQIIHLNVSWETYEALAAGLSDERTARLAYDGVTLEIMVPGSNHDTISRGFVTLFATITDEWDMDILATGSTTLRKPPSGDGEPDESYYIASYPKLRNWKTIDLNFDPPPDLIVEVDITRMRMDKFAIYGAMRVPEFWRYSERKRVEAFALVNSEYQAITTSRVIPGLPISEIACRVIALPLNPREVMREWRAWLHKNRPRKESG